MAKQDTKTVLRGLIEIRKREKVEEENKRQERNTADRNGIIAAIGKDLVDGLKPVLMELARNSKLSSVEIKEAIKGSLNISLPEIKVKVPETKITVTAPKVPQPKVTIQTPEVRMPKEMTIKGKVELEGVGLENPLPVQLRDKDGNIVNLPTVISGGGSGGGGPSRQTIKSIVASSGVVTVNSGTATTAAGTVVELSTTSTPCKKITIQASPTNTELIVIGDSSVVASSDSRQGIALFPTQSIALIVDNLNKVFFDTVTSGDGVIFIYEN